MLKRFRWLLFVTLLIVTGLTFWNVGGPTGYVPRNLPTIQMVKHLAELTTVKVVIADVMTSRINGMTGGVEAALLVRGDFTVSTDLASARFEQIDADTRRAVLVLPPPRASQLRIDHCHSRIVLIRESGIWRMVPGDDAVTAVVNVAYEDAQAIMADANQQQYLNAARQRAEEVLKTFFSGIGWSITVEWRN
jgi:hypothetical protein